MTTLLLGDCLDKLKMLADNSVDSIVTDPPYGISFMNKKWDYDVPSVEVWKECLRVLKPSGHLLSFSGSRTYHRMAVRIEDAGFEIRDQIMWIYGSGFPKGKTQLKPAHEPIVVARKPGPLQPLNIDDCRIGYNDDKPKGTWTERDVNNLTGWATGGLANRTEDWEPNETGRWPSNLIFECTCENPIPSKQKEIKVGKDRKSFFRGDNEIFGGGTKTSQRIEDYGDTGVIHTNPECPCYILDQQSGIKQYNKNRKSGTSKGGHRKDYVGTDDNKILNKVETQTYSDKGGASRFFYCPKASKKDREEGLELQEDKILNRTKPGGLENTKDWGPIVRKNNHPTVKPTDLMLYLIKLVTPKEGHVLDPFMGSGSTGKAAVRGGYNFTGIEKEQEYFEISHNRIQNELE